MNKKYISYSLTAFYIVFFHTCYGQSYRFQSYNIEQGLPQTQVNAICQDKLGHIWAATLGGLARFDGLDFSYITEQNGLPNNACFNLSTDEKGNIWTISEQGLVQYDGKRFRLFPLPTDSATLTPISLYNAPKTGLWVGFRKSGIAQIINNQAHIYNSKNGFMDASVTTMAAEQGSNKLWIATRKDGLWSYENNVFRQLPYPSGDFLVEKILFNANHQPILVTPKGLVALNEHNNLQFFVFPKGTPLVTTAVFLPSGQLCIGTNHGLFTYNFDGKITQFSDNEELENANITKIEYDREANIWISTDGQGLFKATPSAVRLEIGKKQLSNSVVMTICEDKEQNLWFGTYNLGVFRQKNGVFQPFQLPSKTITCSVLDNQSRLWFGTNDSGIYIIDKQKVININTQNKLLSNRVLNFLNVQNNTLWISTTKGLCQYKNGIIIPFLAENVDAISISSLLEIGRDSILYSSNKGLYLIHNQLVTPFLPNEMIGKKASLCMAKDKQNNIWFGTLGNGLFCWDKKLQKLTQTTTKNGLASDIIYSIVCDDSNTIWCGTGKGFHRILLDKEGIKNIKIFAQNEGIKGLESNQNAILLSNGKIKFGTTRGLYEINPTHIYDNEIVPQLALKSVRLFYDEKEILKYGKDTSPYYSIPYELSLPPSQNHLTFDFVGISHTQPEGVRYRYMIQELDKDWSPITEKNSATYSEIPPGKYTFKVMACNSDGIWTKQALTYSFTIQTPFYKSRWAQLFYLLGLIGLGAGIQAIRTRMKAQRLRLISRLRTEEQNKIRQKTAEDFHDELGNKLTRIAILTDIMETKLDAHNIDLQSFIQQIRSNTKELYHGTKDILWSLGTESDNLYASAERLYDFAIELFSDTDIELLMTPLDKSMKNVHLQLDYSRNIQMICKEALNNILRHAKAKQVFFEFQFIEKKLVITIQDDGLGFDTNQKSKGNGLQNIRLRAARVQAQYEILSEPANGTNLRFTIEMPKDE